MLYVPIVISKELFLFCLAPGQGEVTMQAFLKGTSVSTKPPLKDRVAATAASSGENKKAKPVPWVEK